MKHCVYALFTAFILCENSTENRSTLSFRYAKNKHKDESLCCQRNIEWKRGITAVVAI